MVRSLRHFRPLPRPIWWCVVVSGLVDGSLLQAHPSRTRTAVGHLLHCLLLHPKRSSLGRFSGGRPLRQGVPYAASLFVFGNCLSVTEGLGGDVRHHRFSRGILFECLNLGRLLVAFGIFSRMAKQCLKGHNMCGNGKHRPRGHEQVFAQSFECIIFDKFH